MRYIVMDLEWNQPLFRYKDNLRQNKRDITFEVIQIGAVMLDEQRRMRASFNRFIAPERHKRLHPRVKRITGISQEDVADAPHFMEAFEQFLLWGGDDAIFLTWGGDDLSVLKQNLDFYERSELLPRVYDLQKLFGKLQENCKLGLSSAITAYGITPTGEHPFHSAVDDAYYTAMIFQRFPDAEAVLNHPETARIIGKTKTPNEKLDSFPGKQSPESGHSADKNTPVCPRCGKSLSIPEGFVKIRDNIRRALGDCPAHGLVFIDLYFGEDEEGRPVIRRRTQISDEQSPAYVMTKHLQWKEKIKREENTQCSTSISN